MLIGPPPVNRLLLALGVLLTACTAQPSGSALPPASEAASTTATASASAAAGLPISAGDDFYYPTDEAIAEAAHGEIIQSLEIQGGQGMRAWFVVYRSAGLDGEPVAVSGMVLAPESPPADGGYPVVAWAHGTTGIADECAPSKAGVVEGIPTDVQALVAQGYVVTATDYEGLGTDGIHPYLVGLSEGRSVLDSISAAIALPDAHAGEEAVVIGISQGGHAALWAAQLQPTYAADLSLLGAFAASPPADLLGWEQWAFAQAAAGSIEAAAAPILLFGVWNAVYDVPLDFLTDAGQASALAGREACFPTPFSTTPFSSDPAQIAEWRDLLAGNSPGAVLTDVPIRVVSPEDDESVAYNTQVSGVQTMCAIGDTVELWTVAGRHDDSIMAPGAWADAVTWITDRFAGVAEVSTCSTSPS